MTFHGTRSQPPSSASWVAAVSAVVLLAACSSETASTPPPPPSPSPTVQASPSPSPVASSDEVPVAQQVLPPATDPPAANLCTKPIATTSDGNASPLTCANGALNVQAWEFYATISASVLGLGLNPTQGQAINAMCDDLAHNGATRAQEPNGYRLARLYYGWSFNLDPTKLTCQ